MSAQVGRKPRVSLRGFAVVWVGQLVSLVGNAMLRFAFVVQAWSSGEKASRVVLLTLCALLPQVLFSPTAGALVDRLRKRNALRLADLCGLAVVGALLVVHHTGELQLWQMYTAAVLLGAASAFHLPALASSVPLLAGPQHLSRANGLLGTARSTADVCGPALAGVVLAVSGLGVVLWANVATGLLALLTLQLVRFGDEQRSEPRERSRLAAESVEGLRYLFSQPSLRVLVIIVFSVNLVMVFGYSVMPAMVLARSGNDSAVLAAVMSCTGIGGVAGGLLLGAWGGPRSRVRGMLFGIIGMCLTSLVAMATARGVLLWCAFFLAGALLNPIVNGLEQAIVQVSVPPERLGRVFGAMLFAAQISAPAAMILAAPLADHIFEPQARTGTGLVGLLQPVLGQGPGTGLATMLLLAGLCGIAVSVWGLLSRPVGELEVLTRVTPENAAVK